MLPKGRQPFPFLGVLLFKYLYERKVMPFKRIFAVALLLLYVNSYTEFHETLRLPILLEHYSEHRQLVNDMSFWEFLVMHYKTDVAHDDHDNSLPFKHNCLSFATSPVTLPALRILLIGSTPLTIVSHCSSYSEAPVGSHLTEIFQPPRHS